MQRTHSHFHTPSSDDDALTRELKERWQCRHCTKREKKKKKKDPTLFVVVVKVELFRGTKPHRRVVEYRFFPWTVVCFSRLTKRWNIYVADIGDDRSETAAHFCEANEKDTSKHILLLCFCLWVEKFEKKGKIGRRSYGGTFSATLLFIVSF